MNLLWPPYSFLFRPLSGLLFFISTAAAYTSELRSGLQKSIFLLSAANTRNSNLFNIETNERVLLVILDCLVAGRALRFSRPPSGRADPVPTVGANCRCQGFCNPWQYQLAPLVPPVPSHFRALLSGLLAPT